MLIDCVPLHYNYMHGYLFIYLVTCAFLQALAISLLQWETVPKVLAKFMDIAIYNRLIRLPALAFVFKINIR